MLFRFINIALACLVSTISLIGQDQPTELNSPLLSNVLSDTVYLVVDEMPRFPGCEDSGLAVDERYNCSLNKLLEHVYQQLVYPEEARSNGISGRVIVSFVVDLEGHVRDPEIVRPLGYGTDEAVLAVVNAMPQWRPGYLHGEPVNVQFILPVSFKK